MRLKFSRTVPEWLHDELRELTEEASFRVSMTGVEVHIKSAGREYPYFSGYAYNHIPTISRTASNAQYLITLHVPWRHWPRYPKRWQYPGMKTAPKMTFTCWQDDYFHMVAHEAYHIKQFRTGMSHSEVRAERWALKRLIEVGRHQEVDVA